MRLDHSIIPLLTAMARRGVALSVRDGDINYRAPAGTLTEPLKELLSKQKHALIDALSDPLGTMQEAWKQASQEVTQVAPGGEFTARAGSLLGETRRAQLRAAIEERDVMRALLVLQEWVEARIPPPGAPRAVLADGPGEEAPSGVFSTSAGPTHLNNPTNPTKVPPQGPVIQCEPHDGPGEQSPGGRPAGGHLDRIALQLESGPYAGFWVARDLCPPDPRRAAAALDSARRWQAKTHGLPLVGRAAGRQGSRGVIQRDPTDGPRVKGIMRASGQTAEPFELRSPPSEPASKNVDLARLTPARRGKEAPLASPPAALTGQSPAKGRQP